MKTFILMLKGFIIGSSMSVPGVSGGTMAILLGIYDRLISSISHFTKDVKGNLLYLAKFLLGSLLGIGTLAFLISWLLERFPLPVAFFFLGAVVGGVPAIYKKTRESKFGVSSAVYILMGLAIIVGIGFIPKGVFTVANGFGLSNIIMWLAGGIIIAIALVLPGISTSHMLLVLGMYETTLAAIKSFDFAYILFLALGVGIGVILTTRPLEWTMNKFPHRTYCIILGFVIGSTGEIFKETILPNIPQNADAVWWVLNIVICLITFVLGIMGIMSLSRFAKDE